MTDAHQNLQANQSVLGYILRERIGVGGYGEVWSAEAPGGMLKAVKFIFGFHDEKRAQRELKALDRIKHIRHPFLLSLERIDIVDGRMVVITELAEMCMKTRFNQCLETGMAGIEREELVMYVRESADALDYIAESFSLAHLDIKPENLLLVGGHAKVADFGLVKDLQAVNQSLMDGLTPAYAAPELFDGRPGLRSDQYSLAIVYQEMLTGSRPFSGATAAQLANQHLHSRPNLNDLPRADQAVVARALAKQPDKRFPNCGAFVEELSKRKNRVRRKSETQQSRLNSVDTQGATQAGLDVSAIKPDVTMTISESFIPAVKYEADVDKLEPFQLDESQAQVRPTLIIGVGQTGAKILCNYRKRISARIGSPEKTPAIRLLCLDVDRRTLFESTMGDEHCSLRNHETLNIPLRKPEEYRNDGALDVSWIGRRWIYNIPKSLLTESLRPLGRLAFVDHHELIYRKITDELSKAAQPEHLATTAEATGMLPSELPPQIIFVGSVAGGLGSGMILDLAFTTRVCMAEQGISTDHLFGLFSHSTSRNGGDHRLAIANSFSFLNEMYHFNLNGYPGNDACDVPAFDDQTPVLDGTYLVHFGDDISTKEYERAIDGMAEYLFSGTVTRCTAFFDECRQTDEFEAGMLKTMGISSICQGQNDLSDDASERLIQKLLGLWLDEDGGADFAQSSETIALSIVNQTIVANEQLEPTIVNLVKEQLGDKPQEHLLQQVNTGLQVQPESKVSKIKFVDKLLNDIMGIPGPDRKPDGPVPRKDHPRLCDILESQIAALARKLRVEIAAAVTALIDQPKYRLIGARVVADTLSANLHETEVELEHLRDDCLADYDSTESRLQAKLQEKDCPHSPEEATAISIAEMVADRLRYVIESYKRKLIRATRNELAITTSRIDEHYQNLDLLRNQLRLPMEVHDIYARPGEEHSSLYQLLVKYATDRAVEKVADFDQRLEERVLRPEGGVRSILNDGGHRLRLLPGSIKREAQVLVSENLQDLRLDSM
ncbi:MAG: protein kinase domain-containing protein, partial [Pirellulaceae bacterium]